MAHDGGDGGASILDRHPFLVVGAVAAVGALVHAWWAWNSRHLGAYDPDEVGYLADALRFQRAVDLTDPSTLWGEVRVTPTAPLVPLLSIVPLTLGPRDVRAAMLVQPVLLVALALAVAGIAKRFAGPRWAVVAGVTTAGLPAVVITSTAYWFGLATAAVCTLAALALLASDRLANRWTWAFGVALGALPLCRTMAIAFVPGLVGAALVLAGSDRRRLVRLGLAVAVAVVVAGPWWWAQRVAIWDYLFTYGYGEESSGFGPASPLARVVSRVGRTVGMGSVPAVLLLLLAVAVVVDRLRSDFRWRPLTPARREAVAVAVAAAAGFLALLTTRNEGTGFELPVAALAFPLACGVASKARWAVARAAVVVPLLGMAVVAPIAVRVTGATHLTGVIREHEPGFSAHGEVDPALAAGWWDANVATAAALRERTGGYTGGLFSTGNTFLLNSNSLELAAELGGWSPPVGVVDTFGTAEAIDDQLAPARFLVVVDQDRPTLLPDEHWRRVRAVARRAGWRQVWSRALPSGGRVAILRAPG